METCYYPDGFEEFYISIDEYRNSDGVWEKGFVVSYDDIEKGINIYCSMDLSVSEFLVDKTKDNGDVKIDNYVFQEDYSESHVCDITDYADNQRLLNSMVYNAINGCEDDGTRNGKPDKDCIQVVLPAALVTLFDIQRGYSHERRITTSKYE